MTAPKRPRPAKRKAKATRKRPPPGRIKVQFKVDGRGVAPEEMSIGALGADLQDLDRALRHFTGAKGDELIASLADVRSASADYDLLLRREYAPAYGEMNRAASRGDIEALGEAWSPLQSIADRHRQRAERAVLGNSAAAKAPSVELTKALRPRPQPAPLRGSSTLYGVVTGVNLRREGVHVVLQDVDSGKRFVCSAPRPLGKKLAARLEEEVGVEGEAVWDGATLEIIEFKIDAILDFEPRPLDELIAEGRNSRLFEGWSSEDFLREFRGDS